MGAAFGILLSFPASWLITVFKPLYTVQISLQWVAIAVAAALAGSLLSALYPAWRTTRVDMVEALAFE